MDTFQLWTNSITNPSTRRHYSNSLWLLLTKVGLTPEEALSKVKAESKAADATTYAQLVQYAKGNFTEHASYMMVMALRKFLYDNGVQLLPPTRMSVPRKVKPATVMKWEEANRICDAASKPYNLILKLMLFCGWGIHEFLTFNRPETWKDVKSFLASKPNAEYYRFNFSGRKKSRHQWYSLIPATLLREVIVNTSVPIATSNGVVLNLDRYLTGQKYIGSAFDTALHRAVVQVQGKPSPHELRDCFRTRAVFTGCVDAAAEFALGHAPDAQGYIKSYNDEAWTWSELKKIYGPTAASEAQVAEVRNSFTKEITVLQEQNRAQQSTLVALLTENAMGHVKDLAKKAKRHGVRMTEPARFSAECPVCRPKSHILANDRERLRVAFEIHVLSHFDPEEAARRLHVPLSKLNARSLEDMRKFPTSENTEEDTAKIEDFTKTLVEQALAKGGQVRVVNRQSQTKAKAP